MGESEIEKMDPESKYLMEIRMKSKRISSEVKEEEEEEDGFEWDNYKENIRPLKRGRNVNLLNESLKSHSKHSLLLTRSKLIEAIDQYVGDDPLHPWLRCIKWVEEAFPAGGDSSGLLVIYEQCVRTFWHDDRYRDDLRYLKVWLEYAQHCEDAQVIYQFLEANKIGQSHSSYYISYALHLESKHKIKAASQVYERALSINAQPRDKLEAAYRKFIARSMGRSKATSEENVTENGLSNRGFGTVLSEGENRRHQLGGFDVGKTCAKGNKGERVPLSVYKDTNVENTSDYQVNTKSWNNLATFKERNKENRTIPAKWTSFKVLQRPESRLGRSVTPAIQVFVDEECSEMLQTSISQNCSNLLMKDKDGDNLNRESELLKKDPLRNFPPSSFPR